jgi:hypothetical protein
MLDATALIEKHRGKGVLVDANLLVLMLVGSVNITRIQNFKRTSNFDADNFRTLKSLCDWFGSPLIVTPHILSQASDLCDLGGSEGTAVRRLFQNIAEVLEERYDPAVQLVQNPVFGRFGLADASIAAVCAREILVLTADIQLQVALASRGLDALNFNHVRPLGSRRS